MARIKTEVQVVLDVPDELAPRLSKQDVCDTVTGIPHLGGAGAEVLVGERAVGRCQWTVEPNFDPVPAGETDVLWAEGDFDRVEG